MKGSISTSPRVQLHARRQAVDEDRRRHRDGGRHSFLNGIHSGSKIQLRLFVEARPPGCLELSTVMRWSDVVELEAKAQRLHQTIIASIKDGDVLNGQSCEFVFGSERP